MSRHNSIDYIEFTAADLSSAKAFYSTVFGWSFEDYGPDYTSFQSGSVAGGFSRGNASSGARPLVVIYVEDLAAAERRVKEAGGTITREIFSFPGGSRFHFADPNGIELAAWHEE